MVSQQVREGCVSSAKFFDKLYYVIMWLLKILDPTNLRHTFTRLSCEPNETTHNFCTLGIILESLLKWQCKTSNWHYVCVGGCFEKESFDLMLQRPVYFSRFKERHMTLSLVGGRVKTSVNLTFCVVTSVLAAMMYCSNNFGCVYSRTTIIWEIPIKALFTLKFCAIESSLTSIFQYSTS